MPGPLADVSVVDAGQIIAGPLVGTYLGDLGADVVKVEPPGGEFYRTDRREIDGEGVNPIFEQYNRNKRAVSLDLKSESEREALYRLVEAADVFVQNWPPGVAERLGVDYETLREHNEGLVYVHVTGYGETGPGTDRPAMDAVIQHVSGFASLMGFEDDPPIKAQTSVADYYAGMNGAIGALAALRHRDRTGSGEKVAVSMLDSMVHNMDAVFEFYNNFGEEFPRGGRNAFTLPDMLYGAAEARDGWVCVALMLYNDRIWEHFCELVDRPELIADPAYEDDDARLAEAARFTELFEEWLADRTVEEALDVLDRKGIPAARHNTVAEASDLPQLTERDVFVDLDHPRVGSFTLTRSPIRLDGDPAAVRRAAPAVGEHTREVLEEVGYDADRIARLRDR